MNANRLLTVMPENILWCYSCWQLLYQEVLWKYPFIKLVEDLSFALLLITGLLVKPSEGLCEKMYLCGTCKSAGAAAGAAITQGRHEG